MSLAISSWAKILSEKGTAEIHYLGQNVNNFKGTYKGEISSLAQLIELTGKIDGIESVQYDKAILIRIHGILNRIMTAFSIIGIKCFGLAALYAGSLVKEFLPLLETCQARFNLKT